MTPIETTGIEDRLRCIYVDLADLTAKLQQAIACYTITDEDASHHKLVDATNYTARATKLLWEARKALKS